MSECGTQHAGSAIEEVADGVLVLSGRYVEERRGLVCGTEWAILVDAPQHFDEAEQLRLCAEERTAQGVRIALITHGHLDHTATLQAFPGSTAAAMFQSRDYMLHKGQQELERVAKDDPELQQVRLVVPMVTFVGEGMVFGDNGRRLRCIPAPGHSQDSMLVLLEPEHILFTGDTLSAIVPPYFPDGSSAALRDSIAVIPGLGADTAVPGHGPILRGPQIQRECVDAIAYLETLRQVVTDGLEAGRPVEEMQERITWESCSPKPRPPEQYMKYHCENIGRMASEVSARTPPAVYDANEPGRRDVPGAVRALGT